MMEYERAVLGENFDRLADLEDNLTKPDDKV